MLNHSKRSGLALAFSAQQDRDPCTIHKNKTSQAFLNKRNEEIFLSLYYYKLVTFYYIHQYHPFLKEKPTFSFFLQEIFTSLQQNIIYYSTKRNSHLFYSSIYPPDITSLMHLEKKEITDYLLCKEEVSRHFQKLHNKQNLMSTYREQTKKVIRTSLNLLKKP